MIPVSIPYIAKNQKQYVNDCLDRNWISSFGKYDKLLSESFAEFIGTKYAATCSNGTVAIHLALLAANVRPGDEVVLPNFNGPYALFACGYVNAKPLLVDINEEWDVNIEDLKKIVSPKTKAIIIPHLYGIPSRIEPLIKFCKKNNIVIIEDCAEAHGALEKNKKVGSIGDIGCFSFYANKIIASGEGGICTTSSKKYYDLINYYKNQTFNKGTHKTFIHDKIGYNYRMSDLQCSIAFSHLEEIEYILEYRNQILKHYKKYLPDYIDNFQMKKSDITSVNWVTTFEIKNSKPNSRDKLEVFLHNNNIQSRRFFAPMSHQPIFNEMNGKIHGDLIISEKVSKRGIYLPTYIGITEGQIKNVCDQINLFLNKV
jgi:perosamine synthetase